VGDDSEFGIHDADDCSSREDGYSDGRQLTINLYSTH
jgi:hypothetical protein